MSVTRLGDDILNSCLFSQSLALQKFTTEKQADLKFLNASEFVTQQTQARLPDGENIPE